MEQGMNAPFYPDQHCRAPPSLTWPPGGGADGFHKRNAVKVNDSSSASVAENDKNDART